jgi:hypothetical protein
MLVLERPTYLTCLLALHDYNRARRKWWMDSFDGANGVILDLVNELLLLK